MTPEPPSIPDPGIPEGRGPEPFTTPDNGVPREKIRTEYVPQPGVEYCQPTSSKVMIENMVTDEMDDEHYHEFHTPDNSQEQTDTVHGRHQFWDWPVPLTHMYWSGDACMPVEWNLITNDLLGLTAEQLVKDGFTPPYTGDATLGADESVGPYEFTRERYPNPKRQREILRTMRVESKMGADSNVEHIAKMREENELRNHRCMVKDVRLPLRKGKGKAVYTECDIPSLCEGWYDKYKGLLQGVPEEMPPFREVNHEIPLIDNNKKYHYHLPRCLNSLKAEFSEKVEKYTRAGWWKLTSASQAAPMLCLPKKDRHLRTVVDCRQRNENMVKDMTPMPDQENIREDVARAKYRSKIDLSDAYKQVRIVSEDIWKMSFATIRGTYTSAVMQQGDCNVPATFQRLMTSIFQDVIGIFMHVYIDDIFIFSDTIEEHQRHLGIIFEQLREQTLYLKWKKCELYARRIECLGYIIDDDRLHADEDKLTRIMEWRTPQSYHDIQRFVGLVQYLSVFLPDIMAYTGPLLAMTQNGNMFNWRPIHQCCFDMIKLTCSRMPILRLIDPRKDEPIWIVCDTSKSGIGVMYGQGESWQKCCPAGFMSKKFTAAQHNYRVHELETLAILEALMKWEDKLIGYHVHVITDHKALEFFKTQVHLTGRQMRWMDYLSRFDFDITYIKGENNKVADCLSQYYENDRLEDIHREAEYVHADARIDPTGEDLPPDRFLEVCENTVEIRAMQEDTRHQSRRLQEKIELCDVEAAEMADTPHQDIHTVEPSDGGSHQPESVDDDEFTLETLLTGGPHMDHSEVQTNEFMQSVRTGYTANALFKLILDTPGDYTQFSIHDGLIWTKNQ